MGMFCTRPRIRRAATAPAPDAQQSTQSLCRSRRAEFESESAAAAPAQEWPGKETRREAERVE